MKLLWWFVGLVIWCVIPLAPISAQDAIVPHGDPRKKESAAERARREEIRAGLLKQQGQGEKSRIEGERKGGSSESTVGAPLGSATQDTGLADPSVNPGQASGLKSVQGRIVKSDDKTHLVRQPTGGDTTIVVDERTRGDKELRPGDLITSTVTSQGRAVVVKKEPRGE